MPSVAPYSGLPLPAGVDVARAFTVTFLTGFTNEAGGLNRRAICPGESFWVPLAMQALLTTSANAGTRFPAVVLFDADNNVIYIVPPSVTQGPSAAVRYSFVAGVSTAYGGPTQQIAPLPAITVPPSWSLLLGTGAVAAGDVWSGIALTVIAIPSGGAASPSAVLTAPTLV